MKILMLAYEFPRSMDEPVVSGEVKNPYHLVRGLAARGHDVTVISIPFLTRSVRVAGLRPGSSPATYDVPDGSLRSVARYTLRIRNLERFLGAHMRDGRYDVIHAQAPALAAAAVKARRKGAIAAATPIVTTAHGTYVPEVEGDRTRRSPREIARAALGRLSLNTDRQAFARSDVVIAASRHQEAEMADIYRVPRENLEVIYNGIDLALYRPEGEVADLPGVGDQDEVVLFVGRLVPKKGLQHLISAFPAILGNVPNARCVVVGGTAIFDTFGPTLRKMVADAGLTDRFTWLHDVAESRLPSVYRRASVAVFPSINYESLPTVVMEAMAAGVPVVATNRWGTPEALGSSHPGLVAQAAPEEIAGAVTTMLLDETASDCVVRDQFARLEPLGLDTCVTRHLDLYAKLAAELDAGLRGQIGGRPAGS